MRPRSWLLGAVAALAVAACAADSDVEHLASDPLDDWQLPDPPTRDEPGPDDPDDTPIPPDTSGPTETPGGPDTPLPDPGAPTPPAPDGPSPGDPERDTPIAVEPEYPADCETPPEDAPSLIVTAPDGGVYQAGPAGAQVLVAPGAIDEVPHYAFRGLDGVVWFASNNFSEGTIYTFDGAEFTERASGPVSFQHVGSVDGEAAATYADLLDGVVYVETTDGRRAAVADAVTADGDVGPLGIGDGVVTIVRHGHDGTRFEYVTTDGVPHEGWYNPTTETDDGIERTLVTPDPDNERLAWFEPGIDEAVFVDAATGDELGRVQLAATGLGFSSDFTGRWYVYTADDPIEPVTYLVDLEADDLDPIVPCVPVGKATIDRLPSGGGEGGEEPDTSLPGGSDGRT